MTDSHYVPPGQEPEKPAAPEQKPASPKPKPGDVPAGSPAKSQPKRFKSYADELAARKQAASAAGLDPERDSLVKFDSVASEPSKGSGGRRGCAVAGCGCLVIIGLSVISGGMFLLYAVYFWPLVLVAFIFAIVVAVRSGKIKDAKSQAETQAPEGYEPPAAGE